MNKFIVGFGTAPQEYVINGVRYVVESRFQKSDYKKPNKNILLNNRIGSYLTSDFAKGKGKRIDRYKILCG